MSASATISSPRGLSVRGTRYPVVLPSLRDPRLHLAAVIVSLQVLGQVAFDFRLSIAQILIAIGTCAVLEVAIVFGSQQLLVWPASALLTGNGVAFILRVPGTEHGDWWSTNGWWIFAGTAAVSLLSKYLIRFRGAHVFNPSNFGLVLCFLLLGPELADPLDFWWGPMSIALGLALAIIVVGALAILSRLHLLAMALTFWLVFVATVGIVAATGHGMTARWHLGPVEGVRLWTVLAFSPEILVFLFFMLTDPKTVPRESKARIAFAVAVALLATVFVALSPTEFWAKVGVLGALTLVCAVRPLLTLAPAAGLGRRRITAVAFAGALAYSVTVIAIGVSTRSDSAAAAPTADVARAPSVKVLPSRGVDSELDSATVRRIAVDIQRSRRRVQLRRVSAWLEARDDQFPAIVARLVGTDAAGRSLDETVEVMLSASGYQVARTLR